MTDVHLIAGSTGAGKTTFARGLTNRVGGVRFSIDEWMTALFWADCPQPIAPAWAMARVERCYGQIWSIASVVAARGIPVVLDLGFTTRATRARFAGLARDAGLTPRLHVIDVPRRRALAASRGAQCAARRPAQLRDNARDVRLC